MKDPNTKLIQKKTQFFKTTVIKVISNYLLTYEHKTAKNSFPNYYKQGKDSIKTQFNKSTFYVTEYESDENSNNGIISKDMTEQARKNGQSKRRISTNQRTLWSEAFDTKFLNSVDAEERKLCEVKYELITSELSYLNTLNIFKTLFVDSSELAKTIGNYEWKKLFCTILEIRTVSQKFLYDLTGNFENSYLLLNITEVVYNHTRLSFQIYELYCCNQMERQCLIDLLRVQNDAFSKTLLNIESLTECSHTLDEFLIIPIQRLTRLPLLIEAIIKNLQPMSAEYNIAVKTLTALKQIVCKCNDHLGHTM